MDVGSPETWRWIWLLATVAFALGEVAAAGSFFLAPFAVGAFLAAIVAFAGAPLAIEWGLFLVGSAATFACLRPLARRVQGRSPQSSVGAGRWVSREAMVTEDIPGDPGGGGRIRLDGEEWRGESLTGAPIRAGSTVLVSRVNGTRLVVVPLHEPLDPLREGDS